MIELLALAAVLLVLLLLLAPLHSGRPQPALSGRCLNNLRQIGLAMHMFASDHTEAFTPEWMATNHAAAAPSPESAGPATYLAPLRPYIGHWQPFVCPTDRVKRASTNETEFDDSKVSYFVSMTAKLHSTNGILAGDRHFSLGGRPVKPGIFLLESNASVSWTRELHPIGPVGRGSLLFVDGHVEFAGTNLSIAVRRQALLVNRLAVP